MALLREAFPDYHPNEHLLTSFRVAVITRHWLLCLLLTVGDCHCPSPAERVFYTHTLTKPLPIEMLGLLLSFAGANGTLGF